MDDMIFLTLVSTALLGVGWRGGYSSLLFPTMNGTICFCPCGGFRRCFSFVDLIRNLNAFTYLACLLVGPPLKVPTLLAGLILPAVRNGMEEDLL